MQFEIAEVARPFLHSLGMRLGGRRKGERWGQGWREEREGEMGKEKGGFWFSSQGWIPYGDFHVGIYYWRLSSQNTIYWRNPTIVTPSYIVT